jgi:hypothetical protein
VQAPAVAPLEGEYIPHDQGIVVYEDEGFPEFGYDREGPYGRRVIHIDPMDILGPVLGRIGRSVLGPWGSAIGPILEGETISGGELPFPPIPQVMIPEPGVVFPERVYPLPEPPVPGLGGLPVPDVIIVTPEDSLWPDVAPSAPIPSTITAPSPSATAAGRGAPWWWALISGAILARSRAPRPTSSPIYRPISPGLGSQVEGNLTEINQPISLPRIRPSDPLTPPRPSTLTDPLTVTETVGLPFTAPGGHFAQFVPTSTATDEDDRCRCREKKPKKRKKSPSSVVAHLKPFDRRMSTYSLKNLRRGARKS